MLKEYGVKPGPLCGKLKSGHSITAPGGQIITPEMAIGPCKKGRKIGYLSLSVQRNILKRWLYRSMFWILCYVSPIFTINIIYTATYLQITLILYRSDTRRHMWRYTNRDYLKRCRSRGTRGNPPRRTRGEGDLLRTFYPELVNHIYLDPELVNHIHLDPELVKLICTQSIFRSKVRNLITRNLC